MANSTAILIAKVAGTICSQRSMHGLDPLSFFEIRYDSTSVPVNLHSEEWMGFVSFSFLIRLNNAHPVLSTFPAQSTLIGPPCIRSALLSTITSSPNFFPHCAGVETIDLVVCALNSHIHCCRFVSLEFRHYHCPSIIDSRSKWTCQMNTWNINCVYKTVKEMEGHNTYNLRKGI